MYSNFNAIGGDGASSVGVRGLVSAAAGDMGRRPDDWDEDEGDLFPPDFFELGELDFNEDWEAVQPVTPPLLQRASAQPETKAPRRTTDIGNAERFAAQHGADVRYCYAWKKWIVWDGRRWRVDNSGEIERRAKLTARSILAEAVEIDDKRDRDDMVRWALASEKRERLNAMIALAQSEQPIPIAPESLDSDAWLLNCENGTVDLRTGELRLQQRDDFLTKLCPLEYSTEPGDDPVLWLEFLDRIFASDAELIGFVQRLLGMSLVGEIFENVLPIFYGSGSNGKSVLLET
jgi:putative DNA primase/helicase